MDLGLSLGFQCYPFYSVFEGDGSISVFVKIRNDSSQVGTDVQVRVTTADFCPLEAVGE